jgi:hypothetical protein
MFRAASLLLLACALVTGLLAGDDDDVVFRSDVSLVRIDAQVVDSGNRAITHLHSGDFVLREDSKVVPIRNFASENMPLDVLFCWTSAPACGRTCSASPMRPARR